jgi:hypothetical protein
VEEADWVKILFINVVKAGEEWPLKCLMDEEEFQAWRKQKECERI